MGADAPWRRTQWGELLSEFLGTFVLIAFGTGVVAMTVAALPASGRGAGLMSSGDWLLIAWGWGMAVVFGVYVAGGVSGAHLNPAVTLAFALRRGFPWAKVPGYVAAQVVGAFAGAALVYLNYKEAIASFEESAGITRDGGGGSVGIFVTGPAGYLDSYWQAMTSEITGTMFLVIMVFAVVDLMNTPVRANLGPVVIGLAVFAIGMSFGANTGYAINPARDFGPRMLTWVEGWGSAAFPGGSEALGVYWWVPIVAPLIGAAIGAVIYDLFINHVLRARMKPETEGLTRRGEVVEEN